MSIAFRAATANAGQNSTALVAIPAGVQAGDLMLAHFYLGTANAISAPAGWTPIGTTLVPGTGQQSILCWKLAGAGDGGTNLTMPLGGSAKWSVTLAAYAGVDTTTPIDAASSFVRELGAAANTHLTPAVTVGPSNAWAVFGVMDRFSPSSPTFALSTGSVEAQTAGVAGGGSSSGAIGDSAGTVATGALAARTWTCVAVTAAACMFTVILNPLTAVTASTITRVPGHFSKALLDRFIAGGGAAVTPKMYLADPSFVYDKDAQTFWSDVSTHELAHANGYTGAIALSVPATAYDTPTHRTKFSSTGSITFTATGGGFSAGGAFLVLDTGTPSTSLFVFLDFGGTVPTSGQLILTPDATLGWFFGGLLTAS